MKTYNQYLQIIQDREDEEFETTHKGHNHTKQICVSMPARTTFEYSVEIMGMMMQDFLDELPETVPLHFDKHGNLEVIVNKRR